MKDKINTYFATLLVVISGAGATMLIVHVATNSVPAAGISTIGSEASYGRLQKSLLKQQ